jgi:catechol 2,3-dioxygenase-like lactoylglutathione lyase family enzyme
LSNVNRTSVCGRANDSAVRWLGELRFRDVSVRAKLDHCVIHVSDWNRSNAFYRDVLGADLIDRGHGTWAYRFGTQQLNVHGPGVRAYPLARIPVAPGNSDLCFEWDDSIETAVSHLRECGVEIEEGPVPRSGAKGSGVSVYFRDPDGSLLEFITYVA